MNGYGEKGLRSMRLMVEVDYLKDGSIRWQVSERDKGKQARVDKWRASSYGIAWHWSAAASPYMAGLPPPVASVLEYIQRDVRLMGKERK